MTDVSRMERRDFVRQTRIEALGFAPDLRRLRHRHLHDFGRQRTCKIVNLDVTPFLQNRRIFVRRLHGDCSGRVKPMPVSFVTCSNPE